MASYGKFSLQKKKRNGKIWIIPAVIAALALAIVCYVGIVAGSGGEDMERISSAVAENTQLKDQINQLNDEIARLNEEVASLSAQLEARPTVAPTPAAPENAVVQATPGGLVSPRSGRVRE